MEIGSEPSIATTPIPNECDAAVAALTIAFLNDEDPMTARKSNTLPKILDVGVGSEPPNPDECDAAVAALTVAFLNDEDPTTARTTRKSKTLPKIVGTKRRGKYNKSKKSDGVAVFDMATDKHPKLVVDGNVFVRHVVTDLVARGRRRKFRDYDGDAVFIPTSRNHPKLIIGQNQYISHRGVGKIGTWRCSQHSKGCKARVFTFTVGSEIKYRFSCSAHIHRNAVAKSTYFKKKLAKKFDKVVHKK